MGIPLLVTSGNSADFYMKGYHWAATKLKVAGLVVGTGIAGVAT